MENHTGKLNGKATLGAKKNRETGKPMGMIHHALMTRIQCAPESPTFLRTSSPESALSSMVRQSSQHGSSWDRSSDDLSSTNSGPLDEEVCFECGCSIVGPSDSTRILLCARCDGVKEEQLFAPLKFDIEGGRFPISPPKAGVNYGNYGMCFSPARPLELAWEECVSKGFMMTSRVFSFEVMRKITQGVVEKTAPGREPQQWMGVVRELPCRISDSCKSIIVRDNRYDMLLPDFLIEQLGLEGILRPITERLRTIMGSPAPKIQTHNVVFVPVGSKEQKWHIDDSFTHSKNHRHFTILIHLNPIDEYCGGIEVWDGKLKMSDMMRGRPGDAFIFNGALRHRDQGNMGQSHRFYYYATFSCGPDLNVADREDSSTT